ncbi:MAG: hypothetical protein KZQ83_20450 [gamma proteobacterium symbiont of Taylorina sp.]|nr:hypothetical protein [gamma proteobacterium symbiont of Taylorina sp.]
MTHIIVPRTNRAKSYGIILFKLVIIVLLIWGAFERGRLSVPETVSSSLKEFTAPEVNQAVIIKNDNSDELLQLEKQYHIEQQACQIIKAEMEKDQQKIMALEKELIFYRGIVAPEKNKQSIYLQSFEIVPFTGDKNLDNKAGEANKKFYKYKFIVAQKVKKRTQTKGTISIKIRGKQADKQVEFPMSSLLQAEKKQQKAFQFAFKYFIEFAGIISMPDDMTPQAIDIIIKTTKNKSTIELYDLSWSEQGELRYVGQ